MKRPLVSALFLLASCSGSSENDALLARIDELERQLASTTTTVPASPSTTTTVATTTVTVAETTTVPIPVTVDGRCRELLEQEVRNARALLDVALEDALNSDFERGPDLSPIPGNDSASDEFLDALEANLPAIRRAQFEDRMRVVEIFELEIESACERGSSASWLERFRTALFG